MRQSPGEYRSFDREISSGVILFAGTWGYLGVTLEKLFSDLSTD